MPTEQITLEWFGENYHFTEEQTLDLSLDAIYWWPLIRMARIEATEAKQRQEQRAASARRR